MQDRNEVFLYEALEDTAKSFNQASELVADHEVTEDLRKTVNYVTEQIIEMYTQNIGTTFIFVVGGKSRRLTEILLRAVSETLPSGHPAIAAINNRLRLNDQENKNIYGETTTLQQEIRAAMVPSLMKFLRRSAQFIMCDDVMTSGRKVFHTLNELDKKGIEARYIIFAGPEKLDNGTEYLRPGNWRNFEDKVIAGTHNPKTLEFLKKTSSILSTYVNLRLNKNIERDPSVKRSLDKIPSEYSDSLRGVSQLMNKLSMLLLGKK